MKQSLLIDYILSRNQIRKILEKVNKRSIRATESRMISNLEIRDIFSSSSDEEKPFKLIIILGNGPSLNDTLQKGEKVLKKNDLICVNHFPRTKYYKLLQPKYHTVLDPHFGDKESSTKDEILSTIHHINTETSWPLTIFLPEYLKEWNFFMGIDNPMVKLQYFNNKERIILNENMEFNLAQKNKLYLKGCGTTVVHAAIYISIILGYKRNILVGADHSWHTAVKLDQKNNSIISNYSHFYDQNNRRSALVAFENYNMSLLFKSWYDVFIGHEKLDRFAQYCGSEIYNASEFSWLDVYRRIGIDELNMIE